MLELLSQTCFLHQNLRPLGKSGKLLHLNVSDPHVSLHVVADHEVSQHAAGGDLCLLDDVGAEGNLADVLFVFDHRGDGKLGLGWSTEKQAL